jgi:hypothetical protein
MGKWRQGRNVPINVYDDDRPVCQCHTALDARAIVDAMNNAEAIERRVLEKAAAVVRTHNVLHGDLNAGYFAPSADSGELAKAILALSKCFPLVTD